MEPWRNATTKLVDRSRLSARAVSMTTLHEETSCLYSIFDGGLILLNPCSSSQNCARRPHYYHRFAPALQYIRSSSSAPDFQSHRSLPCIISLCAFTCNIFLSCTISSHI